ncbi:MAG: transcriptional regulator [Phycisphaerae bacterium]|nr:transcriptional regulator [Phycisphaerae bacterium]
MVASTLSESKALFVRRWGEMAGYWGINRTMAEIHALLFVSTEPVCTDDVMARLEISRGNASMNLRSLVDWGLVDRVHLRGDRKEYFVCCTDVWQMFEMIVRQRRRREVEPIMETIAHCREMVATRGEDLDAEEAAETKIYRQRLDEMHDFLQAVGTLVDLLLRLGPKGIGHISKMMMKAAG